MAQKWKNTTVILPQNNEVVWLRAWAYFGPVMLGVFLLDNNGFSAFQIVATGEKIPSYMVPRWKSQ